MVAATPARAPQAIDLVRSPGRNATSSHGALRLPTASSSPPPCPSPRRWRTRSRTRAAVSGRDAGASLKLAGGKHPGDTAGRSARLVWTPQPKGAATRNGSGKQAEQCPSGHSPGLWAAMPTLSRADIAACRGLAAPASRVSSRWRLGPEDLQELAHPRRVIWPGAGRHHLPVDHGGLIDKLAARRRHIWPERRVSSGP